MDWFKHDTKALSDGKLQRLMAAHGPGAVTLYWAVVEAMCRDEKPVQADDLPALAHSVYMGWEEARAAAEAMVEMGLLHDGEDGLTSTRAMESIEHCKQVSARRKAAANGRWSKRK